MKLLFWLLLGVIVYWALRKQTLHKPAQRSQTKFDPKNLRKTATTPFRPSSAPVENMVECSYCQIYLPASEAIQVKSLSSEHYFCTKEHAKLHSATDKKIFD
ncbi:MAG: hypothetical protein K0R08_757 [Solimicrobium sp.]|jgi:hypothetical protein|nr:hypothetical protein [Solimicrobium sp.]